jgi:hypothetical protein
VLSYLHFERLAAEACRAQESKTTAVSGGAIDSNATAASRI